MIGQIKARNRTLEIEEGKSKGSIKYRSISSGYRNSTFGKGFVASKGTARQAGTFFLAVSMVSDLTLFSKSFVVGSVWDTREEPVVPKYVHILETLACSD
jgi:hypothetical protein